MHVGFSMYLRICTTDIKRAALGSVLVISRRHQTLLHFWTLLKGQWTRRTSPAKISRSPMNMNVHRMILLHNWVVMSWKTKLTIKLQIQRNPHQESHLVQHVFADRVAIIWGHVDTFFRGDVYEVHADTIDTKEKICQTFDINCASIEDLQPDSPYVFKVWMVKQYGQVSKYSENSDRVKTCSIFASELVRTQCRVDTSDNGTVLYDSL